MEPQVKLTDQPWMVTLFRFYQRFHSPFGNSGKVRVDSLSINMREPIVSNILSAEDMAFDLKWYHLNIRRPKRRLT